MVAAAERLALLACLRYYRIARVALAANDEDVKLVQAYTKKPVFPMRRGVNADLFSPAKRSFRDNTFRLGYVGRLCPEKNVRFLVDLERALQSDGIGNYRFLVVGEGGERGWLERKLQKADFTGELHGEFLADAYANMDLLVFPSETDTFGNVVLEALASGTPPLVTCKGGPKYLVEDGITGFVAKNESDFIAKAKLVMASPKLRLSLRKAARLWAEDRSWEAVLDDLGAAYQASLHRSTASSQVTAVAAG
jgi:phosphatidylinositol alpha 1,6-mannosyltransferase